MGLAALVRNIRQTLINNMPSQTSRPCTLRKMHTVEQHLCDHITSMAQQHAMLKINASGGAQVQ